jgi:hypothetical protein
MNEEQRRAEWLREDGIVPGQVPESIREEVRHMITVQQQRVRRAKWAAIIAWGMLVALMLAAGLTQSRVGRTPLTSSLIVICQAMLWVSVLLSISYYVRWVALRFKRLEASLSDIQKLVSEFVRRPPT